MTRRTMLVMAAQAANYWESTPVARWSEEQLEAFFRDSPWAQAADTSRRMGLTVNPVRTFLCSARPVREAEAELVRRRVKDPGLLRAIREARAEFLEYLDKNAGQVIALGVPLDPGALADGQEARHFETETLMRSGRKKIKMSGHIPPAPSDPVVRILFPRDLDPKAKQLEFDLYIPGTGSPYRSVYYKPAEMLIGGKLEL